MSQKRGHYYCCPLTGRWSWWSRDLHFSLSLYFLLSTELFISVVLQGVLAFTTGCLNYFWSLLYTVFENHYKKSHFFQPKIISRLKIIFQIFSHFNQKLQFLNWFLAWKIKKNPFFQIFVLKNYFFALILKIIKLIFDAKINIFSEFPQIIFFIYFFHINFRKLFLERKCDYFIVIFQQCVLFSAVQ